MQTSSSLSQQDSLWLTKSRENHTYLNLSTDPLLSLQELELGLIGGNDGMKKNRVTDTESRNAGKRWSGFSDGEALASRKLSMFIIWS